MCYYINYYSINKERLGYTLHNLKSFCKDLKEVKEVADFLIKQPKEYHILETLNNTKAKPFITDILNKHNLDDIKLTKLLLVA